jgi:hypothetical protein
VVKAIFGDDGRGKLLDFICGCIIPHKQSFYFYLQKGVRHFESTTNSGHKGTNHAIKSGPSCVLPQHAIGKSAKIQLDKDCSKLNLYRRHYLPRCLEEQSGVRRSPVNNITPPAVFMQKFGICACENYASCRINNNKWLVVRSVEQEVHSLIPRFHRVYTITWLDFEDCVCLMCDCTYVECNGMVCQHLVHV